MPKEIKPKSKKQRDYYKAIKDLAGYIYLANVNSQDDILFTLTHDIMGLANQQDTFFLPRTNGHAIYLPKPR